MEKQNCVLIVQREEIFCEVCECLSIGPHWTSGWSGVTRRRPCSPRVPGWVRRCRDRTARRSRCACPVCPSRARILCPSAWRSPSQKRGPWVPRCEWTQVGFAVRPSRSRTCTGKRHRLIGRRGTRRTPGQRSRKVWRRFRNATADVIRCWIGEIASRRSRERNSNEASRLENVHLRMALTSAWHPGRAWSGFVSGSCTSIARSSTRLNSSNSLLGKFFAHYLETAWTLTSAFVMDVTARW